MTPFAVPSIYLALFIGFMLMAPLAIVKVARGGMGIEHEQSWRRAPLALAAMLAAVRTRATGLLSRWHVRFIALRTHALFQPIAVAIAVIAFVLQAHLLIAAPLLMGTTLTEGQHAAEFIIGERPDGGSRESVTVLSGQNLTAGAVVGRVNRGIGRVSVPAVVGTGNGTTSQVFAGPDVQVGSYVVTCTAAVANGGVFSVVCPDGTTMPSLTLTPGAGGTTKYRSRHLNFSITDGGTDFIVGDAFTYVVSTTAPAVQGGTGTGTISALALGPDAEPGNYRLMCVTVVANGGVFQLYRGGPDGGPSLGQYTLTPGSGGTSTFESRHLTFTVTDATDFVVGDYFDVCVFNNLSGGKVVAWDPTTYDGSHIVSGVLLSNVNASSSDLAGVLIGRDAVVQKSQLQWGAAITAAQQNLAYSDLYKRGIIAR